MAFFIICHESFDSLYGSMHVLENRSFDPMWGKFLFVGNFISSTILKTVIYVEEILGVR